MLRFKVQHLSSAGRCVCHWIRIVRITFNYFFFFFFFFGGGGGGLRHKAVGGEKSVIFKVASGGNRSNASSHTHSINILFEYSI